MPAMFTQVRRNAVGGRSCFGHYHSYCYYIGSYLFAVTLVAMSAVHVCDSRPNIENDAFLDTAGLVRKFRYPVEQHPVVTNDGYLLSLVRIPISRSVPPTYRVKPGPPVLFIHGIISSADDWVLNYPWNSPGFMLSDAGYDIWMLNTRGTPYSRHLKHHKYSTAYWDYSFDDIGAFDVTAGIDFVLSHTGYSQLTLIGWSQGSTDVLVALSLRPEYNAKVKLFVALAPVANITHLRSPMTMLIPFKDLIKKGVEMFNGGGILPSSRTSRALFHHLCNSHIRGLCYMPVSMSVGISPHQLNRTRIPVYLAHMPSGTSTKNLIHMIQNRNHKEFRRYDYGEKENLWRYGTPYPPRYPLYKITAPVALFWGRNDRLATPEDVSSLRKEIRRAIVYDYAVPDPQFSHLDFTIGINANRLLHEPVIHLINKFHHGEHLGLYRPEFHQTYTSPPIPPFPMPPPAHENTSGQPVMGIKFASIPMGAPWNNEHESPLSATPAPIHPAHTVVLTDRLPDVPLRLPEAPTYSPAMKPDMVDTQPLFFGNELTQLHPINEQLPKLPLFDNHAVDFGSLKPHHHHHHHQIQPYLHGRLPGAAYPPTGIPPFLFESVGKDAAKPMNRPVSNNNNRQPDIFPYHDETTSTRQPPSAVHDMVLSIQDGGRVQQPSIHEAVDHEQAVGGHFSDGRPDESDSAASDFVRRPPPSPSTPGHSVHVSQENVDYDQENTRPSIVMHPDNNGGFQTDWFPVRQGSKKLSLYDLLPPTSQRAQSQATRGSDRYISRRNGSTSGSSSSSRNSSSRSSSSRISITNSDRMNVKRDRRPAITGRIRGPHTTPWKAL